MKNDSAFPIIGGHMQGFGASKGHEGLTKRELFAAMAMQGLLASPHPIPAMEEVKSSDPMQTRLGRASLLLADALIAELEKTK